MKRRLGTAVDGWRRQLIVDAAVATLGVSQVDVRDVRPITVEHAYEVRLWNWRRLRLSVGQVESYMSSLPAPDVDLAALWGRVNEMLLAKQLLALLGTSIVEPPTRQPWGLGLSIVEPPTRQPWGMGRQIVDSRPFLKITNVV